MKKLIIAFVLGLTLVAAQAASVVINIPANTMTNIISGQASVTSFSLASTNATAVSAAAYDLTSSALRIINPAYTNRLAYLTNWSEIYTNYYGVIHTNSYTNVLVTLTNNAVAAVTNTPAPVVTLSAAANSTTIADGVQYNFSRGIWVTNMSATAATLSVTYSR